MPSLATGAATAASPRSSIGSSTAPGGKLAEALVAALHHDPFLAHIVESTVARSTAGTNTVTITAKASGDVSGKDVSLHVSGTGAGPAVDQDLVSIGGTTWIRRGSATTWEVHPRASAASAIDGLLSTIRLLDDPNQLVDTGAELVDGQALHHLTAVGFIAYRSPDGAAGSYDNFDVWVTDAGIPVIAKASFSASQGTNAIVGNTDIRYSGVGGPIAIVPPVGAPTLKP